MQEIPYFESPQTREGSRPEEQETNKELKQLQDVLNLIDDVVLENEVKEDPKQQELLETSKEQAKKLVGDVLEDIRAYMTTISALQRSLERMQYAADPEKASQQVARLDQRRTQAHDALISSLHAAVRFIHTRFGKMSENLKEDWEEKMEEEGLEVLSANRVSFPEKVLVPSSVDLHQREDITEWAVDIYKALSKNK